MKAINGAISLGLLAALIASVLSSLGCERFKTRARSYNLDDLSRFGVYSSDELEIKDISDFFKRVFGGADDDYWTSWAKINNLDEGSVQADRIPYLDSWYPERQGGTNVNGTLGKYDQAFYKGVNTAAQWEAEFNSRQTPSWYGHCNGTSVAASRFQNPQNTVLRPKGCNDDPNVDCMQFTPADIRALLSEISMNAKAKFISGNRCRLTVEELAARPALRTEPTTMDDCDDVNPASFHLALVNFLARKKQPIIFDMNRDEQVWNYPIYAYSSDIEGPLNEREAARRLNLNIDDWVFNPDAKSWYFVETTISYRRAAGDFEGAGTFPNAATIDYEYILELDENGDVIGGEWVGESLDQHPDFIWMAFEPDEPSGSASRGNPHVSNDEVIKIWAESVGLDPENPFRDKPNNAYDVRFYPKSESNWGIVEGYYQVQLDGTNTGSVFTGKQSNLTLLLSDALKQNAEVDVLLNGKSIGKKKPEDGKIELLFDSPKGVNTLNFNWNSQAVSSTELNWEFRYYAM